MACVCTESVLSNDLLVRTSRGLPLLIQPNPFPLSKAPNPEPLRGRPSLRPGLDALKDVSYETVLHSLGDNLKEEVNIQS